MKKHRRKLIEIEGYNKGYKSPFFREKDPSIKDRENALLKRVAGTYIKKEHRKAVIIPFREKRYTNKITEDGKSGLLDAFNFRIKSIVSVLTGLLLTVTPLLAQGKAHNKNEKSQKKKTWELKVDVPLYYFEKANTSIEELEYSVPPMDTVYFDPDEYEYFFGKRIKGVGAFERGGMIKYLEEKYGVKYTGLRLGLAVSNALVDYYNYLKSIGYDVGRMKKDMKDFKLAVDYLSGKFSVDEGKLKGLMTPKKILAAEDDNYWYYFWPRSPAFVVEEGEGKKKKEVFGTVAGALDFITIPKTDPEAREIFLNGGLKELAKLVGDKRVIFRHWYEEMNIRTMMARFGDGLDYDGTTRVGLESFQFEDKYGHKMACIVEVVNHTSPKKAGLIMIHLNGISYVMQHGDVGISDIGFFRDTHDHKYDPNVIAAGNQIVAYGVEPLVDKDGHMKGIVVGWKLNTGKMYGVAFWPKNQKITSISDIIELVVPPFTPADSLSYAIKENDIKRALELIDRGVDVNKKDPYGKTPLIYALQRHDTMLTRVLIEHGADVNVKDEFTGKTPIFYTVLEEDTVSAAYIVKHGAGVDEVDKDGNTPLIYAVLNNKPLMVKFLLEHGASVNRKGENGFIPLIFSVKEGYSEVARLLIEHGADVNIADNDKYTPLCYAAEKGLTDVVKLLVQHNASMERCGKEDMRPIDLAALRGYLDIVKYLVKHGNDLKNECRDEEHPCVLHFAARGGNLDIVKYLVENGVDIHAIYNVNLMGDGTTILHEAASSGNLELVKYIVNNGVSVNKKDSKGRTPVYYAIEHGHLDILKYLVQQGAELNDKLRFEDKKTALHIAAEIGDTDIINYLIYKGFDVNKKDKKGWSPVFYAVKNGNLNALKCLVKHGARLDIRDKSKKSLIQVAKEYHWDKIVEYLKGLGLKD